jgi:hypothetical protein
MHVKTHLASSPDCIGQAAYTAGRHVVEDPLIADFMADMAWTLVPDEFYKYLVSFGFHVVTPGNFIVYANILIFSIRISNGDIIG